MTAEKNILAYKGFDKDLKCRDFVFEIGGTYEDRSGQPIKVCKSGFHACEHPMNVFVYYPPAESRFAEVILSGDMDFYDKDTKVAASKITIVAELTLNELVQRAVDMTLGRKVWHSYRACGWRWLSKSAVECGWPEKCRRSNGEAIFLARYDTHAGLTHAFGGIVGQDNLKHYTWYTLDEHGHPVESR